MVSQYFWPEIFRVNDLVQGFMEQGHEVTVLTGKPNYPEGSFFPGYGAIRPMRERYHGAEVLRVPLVPRGNGGSLPLIANYLSYAISASLLGPLLGRKRYDLVFVFEPSPITVGVPAILMKRLKGVPLMFWVQDLWPESLSATGAVSSKRVLRAVDALVRFIYRECERLLVQSRGFVPRVESQGVDPGKILYFPNWAEAVYKKVGLAPEAPERGEVPEGFRVMFAGNIGAAQDFDTILGAAERLKENLHIQWVIIGDGRRRRWVEEQVRERGLQGRVRLIGKRPMESMSRYFALADALLVTLRRDPIFSLTVPGKIQSYLACGRPIVAALDGEGARVIEESGAGLTAPAEDADALAEAVLRLYEMPADEREEMGRKGRDYFEHHFERDLLLEQLEGWMKELVGGKR